MIETNLYEQFSNSYMHIAKGCDYSLNDINTNLNNNIIVVGGSGTGKTRKVVIPNIYSAVGSYVICDPKGSLYKRYKRYLAKKGYDVKLIDFSHPERSNHYNPLSDIKTTQDILRIASIIVNEDASRNTSADPFWDAITIMFLTSIIAYMKETNYKPDSIRSILELVREGEREDEDSKKSKLSKRFEEHKCRHPDSWACAQFDNVNQAPYKTYDTIRTTLVAKFAKYDTEELQKMMSKSDFELQAIGMKKMAVFVTVSDTDRSMDDLVNMFFTQSMQSLCDYADNKCPDNRLQVPVRFILDDFATNCRIDEFPRMISSIRSRGISVMLMIQSESQLTQGYGADSKTIISNCDTYVYLGGNDIETAQSVSYRCDKALQQVLYMPVGSCWVFRRGEMPVYTEVLDTSSCIKEMEGFNV